MVEIWLFFTCRTFLCDLGGNPNKKNAEDESSVHCVCRVGQAKSPSAEERRAACVVMILQWRGPVLQDGEKERAQLNAQDKVRINYEAVMQSYFFFVCFFIGR